MKKHIPFYILTGLFIAASFLFIYFRYFHAPSRKAAENFARRLIIEQDKDYVDYVAFDLISHPFMGLVRENMITDYKILNTEGITSDSARVWVMLTVPEGQVRVPFMVMRGKSHWYISNLPEIKRYPHGLPLHKDKDEQGTYWAMDTGGETVRAYLGASNSTLAYGIPVSFLLMDEQLVHKELFTARDLTRVMALSNETLEDMEEGTLTIAGDFPVYLDEGGHFHYLGSYGIPIGSENATLYLSEDGLGRMAFIQEELQPDTIRVMLQQTGFNNLLHARVQITATAGYRIESIVDNIQLELSAGDIVSFESSDGVIALYRNGVELAASKNRWYIFPETGDMLQVLTIERSHSANIPGTRYRGTLEVSLYNNELVLVNAVNLEEYLYSVVPSEMPVSFGLEALKVQAVAARSYALRSMRGSGYRAYGAHVDDSTASQVYNNTMEQEIAIQAVRDTAGQVPFWEDEVVDARFFSTSAGYTANFHEVWSSRDNTFPQAEVPYLTALPQYPGNAPSLYNENNLRAFINQRDLPGYDRFSSFFRWDVTFSRHQLEAVLNHNLAALQRVQPHFVLTRGSDGSFLPTEIPEDIGELLNIEVIKRGQGGNIMELDITTTYGIFKIVKEYNVRVALKPVNYLSGGPLSLNCHDGTTRHDFPLLPSAFAYIDFNRDTDGNIEAVTVYGGGYGHGVGMSQFGTYGLTLLGKTFDQILVHYYPGSKLRNIYTPRP